MAFSKVILTGTIGSIREGWTKFNSLIDGLLSTSSGKGASQIGIEDSAGNLSASNLEDAIAEIYTDIASPVSAYNALDENPTTTTGLTWGYKSGLLRVAETIVVVASGTIGLTDDATNYVEIKTDGTVTKNTTSFTAGRLPLRIVVCASGVQTDSTDKRAWFQLTELPLPVDEGGSGQTSYTDGQILIGNTTGNTLAKSTLTGTANQITITNGTGTITLSLPADVLIPTVLTVPNEGLHLLDTNASHDLIIKPGSDLTADRILTITSGDAAKTIDLGGNLTIADATTISAFGATVVDDADAAAVRTTIGCPSDPAAGTAGLRTLSTTGTTACAGNDARLSDERTPTDASVTTIKLAAAAVSQAKLKTSTHEQTHTGDTLYTEKVLTYAEYGFNCRFKISNTTYIASFKRSDDTNPSTTQSESYVAESVWIKTDTSSSTVSVIYRYVTSSGEVFWVWLLRDKVTGKITDADACSDHCGWGLEDPNDRPHPFTNYDPEKHEILLFNPTNSEMTEILAKKTNKRSVLQTILEDYEPNETAKRAWPTKAVTYDLLDDNWEEKWLTGKPATVVKAVIKPVQGIKLVGMKKKNINH